MEIVIKIPDEVWEKAKEYGHLDICGIELSERVINGVPLPKGHGDLIDEKDLSLMTIHLIDGTLVCNAPTIIEADTEEDKNANNN